MHWDIHIWYVRLAIHLHVVIKKSWWSVLQIRFRCSVWFTCLFSPSKSLLLQVQPIFSFLALLYNRHIKPLLSLFYKLRNYFFTPVFWTCLYNTWIKELLASCPVDLDTMFKLKIPKSYLSSVPQIQVSISSKFASPLALPVSVNDTTYSDVQAENWDHPWPCSFSFILHINPSSPSHSLANPV